MADANSSTGRAGCRKARACPILYPLLRRVTPGLTCLGILRSERGLQGDYAEWLVADLTGLQLAPSRVQKGCHATDDTGAKYQIKPRVVKDLSATTSFDFRMLDADFDFLACVFFSPQLDVLGVLGVLRVPYDAVRDHTSTNMNSYRFRWNRTTGSDPRIEKVVWLATT